MRRAIIVGLAALALAPAAEATPGFRYGVAAGEMTSTSALLWTRSNELGRVRLFVWPAPRKGMPFVQITLRPSNGHDRVVQRRVHGLKPGTRYTYLFSTPYKRSEMASGGTFWTAPAPRSGATVRFAISGDADGARNPATGKPAYNLFQVYGRMAAERNHFNINLGDTIYSDSEVGGVPPALTIPAKWAKYKENLGLRAPAQPPPRHRSLQPLGRPRVRQRLLVAGAPQADPPRRRDRVHATTRRSPTRPGPASTAPSAGASTSSSSSSTSARSAPPRCGRSARTTSRPPRRSRSATRSRRSSRRWRRRCRRPASTRSRIPRGRCSAHASTPRSRRRSRRRRRPGR